MWKDGYHDLNELVLYAKRLFLRVAVTTNGTFPLAVPSDVLWVSIDGLKETHDMLRSNSFDMVLANLKTAAHPKIMVHFTMNKKNWREIDKLLEIVNNIPSVRAMTVQLFYDFEQGEEPLALSPPERKAALERVIKLKKLGFPILNSNNILKAMIENKWKCHNYLLCNVNPNGEITNGCYAENRGRVHCSNCGFTPVAEASGAIDLSLGSLLAGWRTYIKS